MKKLTALIVTEDETVREEMKQLFTELDIEVHISSEWEAPISEQSTYTYYVLDDAVFAGLEAVKIPSASRLIGLIQGRSFDLVRKWMAIGAHEVLVVPEEIDQLKAILKKTIPFYQKQEQTVSREATLGEGMGRVRAFYSAKGGSGKTLLAAMIGQSLQLQGNQRVVLIDFNVQFGGLEVVLGMEPKRSYVDLVPVIQELSITHIQNIAVNDETTGITVLLSPANPEHAEAVTDELVTRVIRTCTAHFDQVLLDLPSDLNTVSFTALNNAHDIYYVMNPDALSVRNLKRAVTLFERFQIGNRGNLSLIINRKNSKSELTEKDISQLVDIPIAGSIRADFYGIQPLLNMGQPFYSKKNDKGASKTAQDVRAMAQKVIINGV